ncbi:hypothetical protein BK026_08580 [Alteromonas sp. V450]|nr:hypothetical protein BK026_08580 [Alteromonas sp. V450]
MAKISILERRFLAFCHVFILLSFAVFIGHAYADHDDEHFIIGYVNHPRVVNHYKPLIEKAYQEIGINATFEVVGGERGLRLLNQEMTDADVIRYEIVATLDNNLIVVEPALAYGASLLLCARGMLCSKSVLHDPDTAIAVTTRFFYNIDSDPSSLQANISEFEDFNQVITLLRSGRFNYAILPSDFSENEIFEKAGIEYLPLVTHKLVHVINKKHVALKTPLSRAIANQLKNQ